MKIKLFFIFIFSSVTILLFQNCSSPFSASFKTGEDSFSSSAQATDVCMKSSKNACLFRKNSVAMAQTPVTDYALGAYLSFGVQLSTSDGYGFLQNDQFSVQTLTTQRKDIYSVKSYPQKAESGLEQAMAYYYLTDAIQFYSLKGSWSAKNNDLKIYVDSNFSGFDNNSNAIHLLKESNQRPAAYDASMILFYLNQANVVKASSGQILSSLSSTAKNCFNTRNHYLSNGCCQNSSGCGAALYLAQADYLTAIYFQEKGQSTAMAEAYVNKPSGSSSCGISRNPASNFSTTLSKAYNACSNSKGLNSAMAAVYSSIWWEVRKKLSSVDIDDFDRLFLEHLKNLQGSMNFSDAIQAAIQIDQSSYSGKFTQYLQSELNRRK